jgi:ribosomal protein S18 acetylase RimI-like enzyme
MQTVRLKNSQPSTVHCRGSSSSVSPEKNLSSSTTGSDRSDATASRSIADRKLALLKRSGLFGEDLKGATVERACQISDLREAYRLVHAVFLGTGYINPEPAGLRLRIFETSSETATFIAKIDGKIVGVISVVGDSPDLGLPSDSAFKAELDEQRKLGKRLCEVTNQAVAEGFRKSAVSTELMKCAISHAMKAGYDEAVASVSPSHHGFYEILNFRPIGSERSYSDKLHDPVVAVSMDLKQYLAPAGNLSTTAKFVHSFMTEGNHFLTCVTDWAKQARRHFLNPELLQQLFVHERNFLAECTPEQLQILRRRWGQEMFEVVTGSWVSPLDGLIAEILPAAEALPSSPVEAVASEDVEPSFSGQLETITAGVRDGFAKPFRELWHWTEEQLDPGTDSPLHSQS